MDSATSHLAKREHCWVDDGYEFCYDDWYYYGRWIVAGVALLIFIIVMVSCCFIARRRRKRGNQPFYGTGWMAPPTGKYGDHNNPNAYPMGGYPQGGYNPQSPYNPPPAYGAQQPQYTGTTFNPNDGYYGAQQHGVSSPPNTYQADNVYPPPPAAPGGTK